MNQPIRVFLASLLLAHLGAARLALAQPARPPRAPAQPVAPVDPAPQEQAPSEAAVRFQRGSELFNVRNFEGALAEFQRSYELSGAPDLLYNLGRTHLALGRNPEAARAIEEYLRRATSLTSERRAEVEALLQQTRSFIARIDVTVEPSDAAAAVFLNGDEVPADQRREGIVVGPGRHTVEARLEGWRPASETLLLASGDRRAVTLRLRRASVTPAATAPPAPTPPIAPPPAPPSAPRVAEPRGLHPRWLIAGAATTGALLLAGAVFGALTSSAHDDYVTHFRDEYAQPDVAAIRDRGEATRLLSNLSFGLAGAFAAATAVIATQTRFGRATPATAPTTRLWFSPNINGGAVRLQVAF